MTPLRFLREKGGWYWLDEIARACDLRLDACRDELQRLRAVERRLYSVSRKSYTSGNGYAKFENVGDEREQWRVKK